jgi:hypothetical protein
LSKHISDFSAKDWRTIVSRGLKGVRRASALGKKRISLNKYISTIRARNTRNMKEKKKKKKIRIRRKSKREEEEEEEEEEKEVTAVMTVVAVIVEE